MGNWSSQEVSRRTNLNMQCYQPQWFVGYEPSNNSFSSFSQYYGHNDRSSSFSGSHQGFYEQYHSAQNYVYPGGFYNNCQIQGNFGISQVQVRNPLPRRRSFNDDYFSVESQSHPGFFSTFRSQVRTNSLIELTDRTRLIRDFQGGERNVSGNFQNTGGFNRASRPRGYKRNIKRRSKGVKRKIAASNSKVSDFDSSARDIGGAIDEVFWRDVKDDDLHEFEEPRAKRRRSEESTESSNGSFLTISSSTSGCNSNSSSDELNACQTDGDKAHASTISSLSKKSDAVETHYKLLKAFKMLSFPSKWSSDYSNHSGTNYVDILFSSPEGKSVENFFKRSAFSPSKFSPFELRIARIVRVENPVLHTMYLLRKEEMAVRFGRVDELFLYHGTKDKHVDKICEENLNWRLCNDRKHLFGRGVSFSPLAHYASHYSDRSNVKVMMLFKVLVSNSVLGSQDMVIPPVQNGVQFDTSMKDDTRVIVKYFDNEFYPLYKIFYTKHV